MQIKIDITEKEIKEAIYSKFENRFKMSGIDVNVDDIQISSLCNSSYSVTKAQLNQQWESVQIRAIVYKNIE